MLDSSRDTKAEEMIPQSTRLHGVIIVVESRGCQWGAASTVEPKNWETFVSFVLSEQ